MSKPVPELCPHMLALRDATRQPALAVVGSAPATSH